MNAYLEIVIGLAFVYLLTSLAATAVMELLSSALNLRARNLEKALSGFLASKDSNGIQVETFLNHALLVPLKPIDRSPSYLPGAAVISALLSSLKLTTALAAAPNDLLKDLPNSPLKQRLEIFWVESGQKADAFRARLEEHYDQVMERAGGWYKRNIQLILLIIGLCVSVSLNIDSLAIARTLWETPTLRAAIADEAGRYVKDHPAPTQPIVGQPSADPGKEFHERLGETQEAVDMLLSQKFPIGWKEGDWCRANVLEKILGLLLSALAISLGAPFWFDTLSKLVNLRGSGKIPVKKGDVEDAPGALTLTLKTEK
jgi:hypothetical protein